MDFKAKIEEIRSNMREAADKLLSSYETTNKAISDLEKSFLEQKRLIEYFKTE